MKDPAQEAGKCIADLLKQIHAHVVDCGEAEFFTGHAEDLLKEQFPLLHQRLFSVINASNDSRRKPKEVGSQKKRDEDDEFFGPGGNAGGGEIKCHPARNSRTRPNNSRTQENDNDASD